MTNKLPRFTLKCKFLMRQHYFVTLIIKLGGLVFSPLPSIYLNVLTLRGVITIRLSIQLFQKLIQNIKSKERQMNGFVLRQRKRPLITFYKGLPETAQESHINKKTFITTSQ